MAEVTDKKTAWAAAKDAFDVAMGWGMDDAVWADMMQAVKDSGSEMPTEEAQDLFLSYLFKFEGEGIPPRQARQMAKEAARDRDSSTSWPLRS